jgi:long-chain acyl-CoA synthetase
VRAGDKLGLLFPNGPELVVAFFAAARLEAIVVPVSPALKVPEVARLAEEMAVDAFLCDAGFHASIPGGGRGRSVRIAGASALFHAGPFGETSPGERARLRGINAAMIRFSSGTTAAAKGIVVSHATLLERMQAQSADLLRPRREILWLQPMTMAFAGSLYVFLSRGARLVIAGAVDMPKLAALLGSTR